VAAAAVVVVIIMEEEVTIGKVTAIALVVPSLTQWEAILIVLYM
jgi:hypothetical protein